MEYTVVCPGAAVNKKKGISITTMFTYGTKQEAEDHLAACRNWAELTEQKFKAYIVEGDPR